MSIKNKALLVNLKISQMSGFKIDKGATEQVALTNNSSMEAGRYNKNLFASTDLLSNIKSKTNDIRKKFYHNTLPWGLKGTHMLPSANFMDFSAEFRADKKDWFSLVDEFIVGIPKIKVDAPRVLGKMYNEADYPTEEEARARFSMDMEITSIPDDDFRVQGISEDELDTIRKDITNKVTTATEDAMNVAWQRLYDTVSHMAETLADPAKNFKNTLVENTQDICSVLTRLNVTDDPNLERLRQEVEASLTTTHPEVLRHDPDARRDTAEDAKAIMDKMGSFMRGGN